MSDAAISSDAVMPLDTREPPRRGRGRRLTSYFLPAFTWIVIIYLMVPVFVMILFGFNNPPGRINVRWVGFSFDAYKNLFSVTGLSSAIKLSLAVAVGASAIATALGALLGLALGRYKYRGSGATNYLVFLAIASPEIVMGTSLLTMFNVAPIYTKVPLGVSTIVIAHIMFSISFVAVTVRARVMGLNASLEEAAQDLFADPITTFRKVTFPLLAPALISGFLLAFALSVDDFIITYFVSGSTATTFPLLINGAAKTGLVPQFNVIGTFLFLGGLLVAVAASLAPNITARHDAKALAQDQVTAAEYHAGKRAAA
jgi:spermidine/putrescine transport system permease protein